MNSASLTSPREAETLKLPGIVLKSIPKFYTQARSVRATIASWCQVVVLAGQSDGEAGRMGLFVRLVE